MSASSTGQRVLVIDDDPITTEMITGMLEHDYEVIVTHDANSAVELAAESRPDAILLDVVMDEIDGYDVCAELKQNEATRDVPVIFVTWLEATHDEAEGFERGAEDFITKPVNPSILRARLQRSLDISTYVQFLETLVQQKDTTINALRLQQEAEALLNDRSRRSP